MKKYLDKEAMLTELCVCFDKQEVAVLIVDNVPYFRGKDVALCLDYTETDQAIRKNVSPEHVKSHEKIGGYVTKLKTPNYVSFTGLMELIQSRRSSKKAMFKEWLLNDAILTLIRSCNLNDIILLEHYREQLVNALKTCAFAAPDDDTPTEGDMLYIMINPLIPHMVKIGRSGNPEARAKQLSQSQPFHIAVAHKYEHYCFLEKLLHDKLKKRCVVGGRGREWFNVELDQARLLVEAQILEHQLSK